MAGTRKNGGKINATIFYFIFIYFFTAQKQIPGTYPTSDACADRHQPALRKWEICLYENVKHTTNNLYNLYHL